MIISEPSAAIADELDEMAEWAGNIGVSIEVELDDDGESVHLAGLGRNLADPSTKGSGRRAMERLCAIADRHGLVIDTEYMTDAPALGPYYGSLGFEAVDMPGGYPHLQSMRRHPGGPA